jgi:hypothetical protein
VACQPHRREQSVFGGESIGMAAFFFIVSLTQGEKNFIN